jgi:hypothetical protein
VCEPFPDGWCRCVEVVSFDDGRIVIWPVMWALTCDVLRL